MLGFLYIFGGISLFIIERKKNFVRRLLRHRNSYDSNDSNFSGNKKISYIEKYQKSMSLKINMWLIKNNIESGVREFIILALITLSVIFMVCLIFSGSFLIAGLSPLITLILIFIDLRSKKENLKKEEQLENFLLDLVGNLYANPNIVLSIRKTLEGAEYPLKKDFEIIIDDVRRGILLNDALRNMIKRNNSRLIEIVLTGFVIANEKGADLIEFLKDQISYIREKKSISNYIKILSSGPRYTSYIIMLIPILSVAAASFINRNFMRSLFEGIGPLILSYAVISYISGFYLINKIINFNENKKNIT